MGCWVVELLTASWGRGCSWDLTGESAGELAGVTWEDRFVVSCVFTSGLCMLSRPCALVCCLCQCEDTIKCIFLLVLTFEDFVGVAIVQGSDWRPHGDENVTLVF